MVLKLLQRSERTYTRSWASHHVLGLVITNCWPSWWLGLTNPISRQHFCHIQRWIWSPPFLQWSLYLVSSQCPLRLAQGGDHCSGKLENTTHNRIFIACTSLCGCVNHIISIHEKFVGNCKAKPIV